MICVYRAEIELTGGLQNTGFPGFPDDAEFWAHGTEQDASVAQWQEVPCSRPLFEVCATTAATICPAMDHAVAGAKSAREELIPGCGPGD